MGRKRGKKRVKSDDSDNNGNVNKAGKFTDSPESVCLSNILGQTNSILYESAVDESSLSFSSIFDDTADCPAEKMAENTADSSVNISPITFTQANASTFGGPNSADIMVYLVKIDKKLERLESLENKIGNFEKEIAKMWGYIYDQNKKLDERLSKAEDQVASAEFNLDSMSEQVTQLQQENTEMR